MIYLVLPNTSQPPKTKRVIFPIVCLTVRKIIIIFDQIYTSKYQVNDNRTKN